MTPQAIYKIIKEYADKLDKEKKTAPQDLRRTFAHLSYDGGIGKRSGPGQISSIGAGLLF